MSRFARSLGVGFIAIVIADLAASGFVAASRGDDKKPAWNGDVYTLDICPITGKKLGSMGEPAVKVIDDREVRFCCPPCIEKFEADKAANFKRIDEMLIEQQIKHYPLKHCVVMEDDPVEGVHDEPAMLVYRNRLVRFCCPECIKEFNAEPAKYIAKLDKAVIEQQKPDYPLTTCPVSGEKLGSGGMGEPVDYVVGVTLIRFCCAECIKTFEKDPLPVIKKVHNAWAAKHKEAGEAHDQAPAPTKPADKKPEAGNPG